VQVCTSTRPHPTRGLPVAPRVAPAACHDQGRYRIPSSPPRPPVHDAHVTHAPADQRETLSIAGGPIPAQVRERTFAPAPPVAGSTVRLTGRLTVTTSSDQGICPYSPATVVSELAAQELVDGLAGAVLVVGPEMPVHVEALHRRGVAGARLHHLRLVRPSRSSRPASGAIVRPSVRRFTEGRGRQRRHHGPHGREPGGIGGGA
jgi:hypothetical protein